MASCTRRRFFRILLGAFLVLPTAASADFPMMDDILRRAIVPESIGEIWVLIDDKQSTLKVYRGNTELEVFAPVRVGRGGAKQQRVMGDRTTPLGEFRVDRFNFDSKFDIFIGLDYPTPTHARMALDTGLYSQQDYDDYFDYYRRHRSPPQETVLGGYIGIHGVGEGDMDIHRRFNWTNGCVAVTDQEIRRLASLIDVGTRVVIR
ncbi:L,D-transpeptidase family protein [Halomonas sp. V046]|uniref:L,D-transpeptidase family protein n=1 Tax=Halomonas sp. V046 TaxID=3459611 RepID=UPI0040449636